MAFQNLRAADLTFYFVWFIHENKFPLFAIKCAFQISTAIANSFFDTLISRKQCVRFVDLFLRAQCDNKTGYEAKYLSMATHQVERCVSHFIVCRWQMPSLRNKLSSLRLTSLECCFNHLLAYFRPIHSLLFPLIFSHEHKWWNNSWWRCWDDLHYGLEKRNEYPNVCWLINLIQSD